MRIQKYTLVFGLVSYGCVTWSLILREEDGLMEFENRVLRKMFGSKREVVTAGGETVRNH